VRSGATRTESWEVIANVEDAAIGLSGRISLNGLLPSPGPVKRIVEGDERCGIARAGGITLRGAGLAGAGFAGATLFGTTALDDGAGWKSAGGGAFRALSPAELSLLELASVLAESGSDGVAVAEDGPIGAALGVESSDRALRD